MYVYIYDNFIVVTEVVDIENRTTSVDSVVAS